MTDRGSCSASSERRQQARKYIYTPNHKTTTTYFMIIITLIFTPIQLCMSTVPMSPKCHSRESVRAVEARTLSKSVACTRFSKTAPNFIARPVCVRASNKVGTFFRRAIYTSFFHRSLPGFEGFTMALTMRAPAATHLTSHTGWVSLYSLPAVGVCGQPINLHIGWVYLILPASRGSPWAA